MAVNKCNITSTVLNKITYLQKGRKFFNEESIYENYLGFLNCDSVDYNICFPDNCSNPTIIFICTLAVSGISAIVDKDSGQVTFYIADNQFVNGIPPYSYSWIYNTADFDLVSVIGNNQIVLSIKQGKTFDALVSQISVSITDSNGCYASKSCYLTPIGIQCASDYQECPNGNNLQIVNLYTQCFGASGLIVNNV